MLLAKGYRHHEFTTGFSAHWVRVMDTKYLTCLPDNEVGRMALRSLKKFAVDTQHCFFEGERIVILYLEIRIGSRASKVIYDRAHSSMATIQKGKIDWTSALKDVSWLHCSGITPAISQSAANVTLEALKAAKNLGLYISCDLNYRSNLWKYGKHPSEVMPHLIDYCDLILGDGDTNALYSGIQNGEYESIAFETMKMFPRLRYVSLTARKTLNASHHQYQGFLYDGTSLYTSGDYNIENILDRLGTGDAFMAGLIYRLMDAKEDLKNVVEFAAAAAAMKHTVYGDWNLVTEMEIESLMAGNTGGKVAR